MISQGANRGRMPNTPVPFMNTLTSCVNNAVKDGYIESFKVTKQGLCSASKDKTYTPQEVRVIDFFRFEGVSDPADNSILYVIETTDGTKGTLIDAYGTYADESINKFMTEVEEINKKTEKHEHPAPGKENKNDKNKPGNNRAVC
jgi:hypothetical protein